MSEISKKELIEIGSSLVSDDSNQEEVSNKRPVIVIDVGHGFEGEFYENGNKIYNPNVSGINPYTGEVEYEYDHNLEKAKILKGLYERAGFDVYLTSDDEDRQNIKSRKQNFPSRHDVFKKHDAAMYISVHHNRAHHTWTPEKRAEEPERFTGVEVFYHGSSTSPYSASWARDIAVNTDANIRELTYRKRGNICISPKGLGADATAILLEVGYMDNPDDMLIICDKGKTTALLSKVADATIKNYVAVQASNPSLPPLLSEQAKSDRFRNAEPIRRLPVAEIGELYYESVEGEIPRVPSQSGEGSRGKN